MGTDVTRHYRLHEAVKVEAVPVAYKGSECGKLPLRHRYWNVKSPPWACNRTWWRTRYSEAHARNHGHRLGYGNVGEPHRRWSQGKWRYKRLHSDLKHQNTTDRRTSLRDLLFTIITRVYTTIELWMKSYQTTETPQVTSLEFFHWHKILLIALWPWGRLSLECILQ
jgi:hypothetical protein